MKLNYDVTDDPASVAYWIRRLAPIQKIARLNLVAASIALYLSRKSLKLIAVSIGWLF